VVLCVMFGERVSKPYHSGNASVVNRQPPKLGSRLSVFLLPSPLVGEGLGVRGRVTPFDCMCRRQCVAYSSSSIFHLVHTRRKVLLQTMKGAFTLCRVTRWMCAVAPHP
jgi:hypothetical protein